MWLCYLNLIFPKLGILQLGYILVSNIYVLKGLKYSEIQMEKVFFKISVTIFQISPITFPPQNFHSLFLVS